MLLANEYLIRKSLLTSPVSRVPSWIVLILMKNDESKELDTEIKTPCPGSTVCVDGL